VLRSLIAVDDEKAGRTGTASHKSNDRPASVKVRMCTRRRLVPLRAIGLWHEALEAVGCGSRRDTAGEATQGGRSDEEEAGPHARDIS
jgi:hypothetical protein